MNLDVQSKPERPYANVLRPLLEQEKGALREWLRRDGLRDDLVRDQHGDLLDGHSREELCNELGIALRYRTVTTENPVDWIKSNQKARRNLSHEEIRALTSEQLIASPHLSNTAIAKIVGVSDMTVGKVRKVLLDKGKINNVVRLDTRGRVAGGNKQQHSKGLSVSKNPTLGRLAAVKEQKMAESRERYFANAQVPKAPEKPAGMTAEQRLAKYGPPPVLRMEKGKRRNFSDSVIYHFADTDEFHSATKMIVVLDPDNKCDLKEANFQKLAYELKERKDIYLETRPGPGQTKLYRYYRQDRTIGLSVLKAKFQPVIELLKIEGQKPISYQSTGRFNDAAALLIQLLRDLEVE